MFENTKLHGNTPNQKLLTTAVVNALIVNIIRKCANNKTTYSQPILTKILFKKIKIHAKCLLKDQFRIFTVDTIVRKA